MPRRFSKAEVERFLSRRRVAVLGTIGADGAPVLTPIWYLYRDGHLLMRTDRQSVKAKNVARDPRVTVCVQDERPPYASVTIHGKASVEPAREELGEEIAKHYLGAVGAAGYQRAAAEAIEGGEEVTLLFMLDPDGDRLETVRKMKETRLSPLPWSTVQRHLRKLARLGFREKLDYLLPRVKDQINVRILHKINTLTRNACLAAGITLPHSLRTAYIFDVYEKALRPYMLRPYSGRVTLVKAGEGSYQPRWDWVKAITGELEIYEVRADHLALQKEPYVRLWAERLKDSLDRAHASMPPQESRS